MAEGRRGASGELGGEKMHHGDTAMRRRGERGKLSAVGRQHSAGGPRTIPRLLATIPGGPRTVPGGPPTIPGVPRTIRGDCRRARPSAVRARPTRESSAVQIESPAHTARVPSVEGREMLAQAAHSLLAESPGPLSAAPTAPDTSSIRRASMHVEQGSLDDPIATRINTLSSRMASCK